MIIQDQEVSLTRVFIIVGVILFISSVIYTTLLIGKLVALKRINKSSYAAPHMVIPPTH